MNRLVKTSLLSSRSMMRTSHVRALSSTTTDDAKYIVGTYKRYNIDLESGEGVYLVDTSGKKYLDFCAGIAVNALGYNDAGFVDTLTKAASKLHHVTNLYYTKSGVDLARSLVESCSLDKAFFANSGTEANEAALKFSRKYHFMKNGRKAAKGGTLSFSGSFHGRTMGSLSLTAKPAIQDQFVPLVPGNVVAKLNDIEGLKE